MIQAQDIGYRVKDKGYRGMQISEYRIQEDVEYWIQDTISL